MNGTSSQKGPAAGAGRCRSASARRPIPKVSLRTPVCALLLLLLLAAGTGKGFAPFRQMLPQAVIDWDEGWIHAEASVPLAKGKPEAQARLDARRVALLKARATALKVVMGVPLDGNRLVEDSQALHVRVKGIVRGSQVVDEALEGRSYRIEVEVPLGGVKGLLSEVYPVYLPSPPPPKPKPPRKAPPEEDPVAEAEKPDDILIDATGTAVRPAIFPKVVDTDGEPVYEVAAVEPEVARKKTIVRYVTPAGEGAFRPADNARPVPPALCWASIGPPSILKLAQRSSEGRRRRGARPLTVQAAGSDGSLNADIVVTKETARRLREAEETSGLLSQAKVIVVVKSDVGGVEGRRSPWTGGPLEWTWLPAD